MLVNYYNEHDTKAAAWLRELINRGLIPAGTVDERSIVNVRADELHEFTQCHFFAGIGGWSYALQLAGVPPTTRLWTGSCPCQPFSTAGKGLAQADERHLWPVFFDLIRQCRPEHVFGEQVASAIGHGWLDGISTDLEGEGYACGAVVLGAHSVQSPHQRQRLYWVASSGWKRVVHSCECDEDGNCPECGIDYSDCGCFRPTQDGVEYEEFNGILYGRVADCQQQRLEGQSWTIDNRRESRRLTQKPSGSASQSGANCGGLVFPDSDGCSAGSAAAAPAGHRDTTEPAGFWSDFTLAYCRDGKTRRIPTEPAFFPLAHGLPARVVRLRGYGNAIVPQVAAKFIQAFYETQEPTHDDWI